MCITAFIKKEKEERNNNLGMSRVHVLLPEKSFSFRFQASYGIYVYALKIQIKKTGNGGKEVIRKETVMKA